MARLYGTRVEFQLLGTGFGALGLSVANLGSRLHAHQVLAHESGATTSSANAVQLEWFATDHGERQGRAENLSTTLALAAV
jgi:hypothetical protein